MPSKKLPLFISLCATKRQTKSLRFFLSLLLLLACHLPLPNLIQLSLFFSNSNNYQCHASSFQYSTDMTETQVVMKCHYEDGDIFVLDLYTSWLPFFSIWLVWFIQFIYNCVFGWRLRKSYYATAYSLWCTKEQLKSQYTCRATNAKIHALKWWHGRENWKRKYAIVKLCIEVICPSQEKKKRQQHGSKLSISVDTRKRKQLARSEKHPEFECKLKRTCIRRMS